MNDDLISRKEAKDALLFSMAMTGYQQRAIDTISFIPSIDNRIVNIGQWHSVKEDPPENEKDVLITVRRRYWNDPDKYVYLVVKAFHTDGKTRSEDSNYVWDYDNLQYDKDQDVLIVPEGWWESCEYSDEFSAVRSEDEVTHWMELPVACREE